MQLVATAGAQQFKRPNANAQMLVDAILADTALEDLAAKEALQRLVAASAAPRAKGQAIR